MANTSSSTPTGFPELNLAEQRIRWQWLEELRAIFAQNGYAPIETPLAERADNLLGKGGNPKEIYALSRHNEHSSDKKQVLLRFDHTVPLALFITRHMNEIVFPFKRSVIGPVFRGERAQAGRFRQFDQCDIDIVGAGHLSFWYDAEIASIPIKAFNKLLPNEPISLSISNRKLVTGYFRKLGLSDTDLVALLRRLDLLSLDDWNNQDVLETLIDPEKSEQVKRFFDVCREPIEDPKQLEGLCETQEFMQGVAELKEVWDHLEHFGVRQHCVIDLRIARGLDYYSATVYETRLDRWPELGSICSGGRYEELVGSFGRLKLPGVGISIGLSRLLSQLFSRGILGSTNDRENLALICSHSTQLIQNCMHIASILRKKNIACDVLFDLKDYAAFMRYADRKGARFAVWLESSMDAISIKDLQNGVKMSVSVDELANKLSI